MPRERVTENIYVFISSLYAEVTAVVIVTVEGAVVIDTLPFPRETQEVRDFALRRCPQGIRYVINTHFHADHVYGSYLFPEAELISHRICREILLKVGEESLAVARAQTPALAGVQLRIPELVFDTELLVRIGEKTIHLFHAPGHTPDGIMVHVREEKALVASDLVTPVPLIAQGNMAEMRASLDLIDALSLENVIQGHGGVLLRGEIAETVQSSRDYLDTLERQVDEFIRDDLPAKQLDKITVESCGLSRIPLGGLVHRLHMANVDYLYTEALAQN